jgi:hypothetical protein
LKRLKEAVCSVAENKRRMDINAENEETFLENSSAPLLKD